MGCDLTPFFDNLFCRYMIHLEKRLGQGSEIYVFQSTTDFIDNSEIKYPSSVSEHPLKFNFHQQMHS